MPVRIAQVDAFTNRPFTGNPAGVCMLSEPADEAWMRAVAAEMNLSETAFVHPERDAYRLRWFTPTTEVALCGHATLASAHILWEDQHLAEDQPMQFNTLSGPLTARSTSDGIELDFPLRPVTPAGPPRELLEGLGVNVLDVRADESNYLVLVGSETVLRAIQPDFDLLGTLSRGVIVTSRPGSSAYDFVSRYFAPGIGIPEDPVTGSAHCSLAPYWRDKLDKDHFRAYQASTRGGVVSVRIEGDRAVLIGQAVTVLRGEFLA